MLLLEFYIFLEKRRRGNQYPRTGKGRAVLDDSHGWQALTILFVTFVHLPDANENKSQTRKNIAYDLSTGQVILGAQCWKRLSSGIREKNVLLLSRYLYKHTINCYTDLNTSDCSIKVQTADITVNVELSKYSSFRIIIWFEIEQWTFV